VLLLVGVAFAGDELLGRADGYALIREAALLAPRCQCCEQAAVDVCSVGPDVPAHFFKMDRG